MNAKLKEVLKGIGVSVMIAAVKGAAESITGYLESLAPVADQKAEKAIAAITPVRENVACTEEKGNDL
jgi:hypothetical protein